MYLLNQKNTILPINDASPYLPCTHGGFIVRLNFRLPYPLELLRTSHWHPNRDKDFGFSSLGYYTYSNKPLGAKLAKLPVWLTFIILTIWITVYGFVAIIGNGLLSIVDIFLLIFTCRWSDL